MTSFHRSPRHIALALILALTAACQGGGGTQEVRREWVGTSPMRETDFDRRTWQDTSGSTVHQLLERLPDRIDSAAQHRLARNLLVSIADAPHGDADLSELLALRVGALMQLGDAADAATLARAGRNPARDEASALREAEAELLSGNVEMGCIDLRALAARSSSAWIEDGVALCRVRAGEPGARPPSDIARLGALARIAGAPLPAEPSSPTAARIAYLTAVAADAKVAASRRLAAGYEAARASALSGDAFAKILKSAGGRGGGSGPPGSGEQAAALFHAIESADAGQKIVLAERGLLSPDGTVDGVGAAMAVPLRTVRAEGALAGRYAAVLFAAGEVKAAAALADSAKRGGQDTASWPYRALIKPPASGELAQWEKRARLDPARQERIAAILAAFDIGRAPAEAGSGELEEIDKAATAQHVGETTLRALAILGRQGPAGASSQTLYHVLKALDRVNLHDEARALAFEAIAATIRPVAHKGDVAGAPAEEAAG